MLISTTNPLNDMSMVSTTIFSDFLPYIIVIIGIIVGFFVLELIVSAIYPAKNTNDTEKI